MDLRKFFTPKPPPKWAKLSPTRETEARKSGSNSSSVEESDDERIGLLDTTTPGETSSSNSSKQALKFKREWLKGRESWLKFVEDMFCELCIKYDKRPFNRQTWNMIPCTRYHLQSVTMHKRSATHRDSVRLELAASTTPTIAHAMQLPDIPAHGMEQAFSCLYFLAKQRIAHTTNFEPLLDLMELMGVPIKSDLHVGKNVTYVY